MSALRQPDSNDEVRVWQRLVEAGLARGDLPADGGDWAPWYLRLMQGLGGWIAALFLFGSVFAGFRQLIHSGPMSIGAGASLCLVAVALEGSAKGARDFAEQFVLAMSLVGQGLVLYGLTQLFKSQTTTVAMLFCLLQVLLFAVNPNSLHRVWSVAVGLYAGSFVLSEIGAGYLAAIIAVIVFLFAMVLPERSPRNGSLWRAGQYGAVGYMLSVQFFAGSVSALLGFVIGGDRAHAAIGGWGPWVGAIGLGILLLALVMRLMRRNRVDAASPVGLAALAATVAVAGLSLKMPGVAAGAIVLLASFANGNRILVGAGGLSVLFAIGAYYYNLQLSLLDKSFWLVGSGLVLLAAAIVIRGLTVGEASAHE